MSSSKLMLSIIIKNQYHETMFLSITHFKGTRKFPFNSESTSWGLNMFIGEVLCAYWGS